MQGPNGLKGGGCLGLHPAFPKKMNKAFFNTKHKTAKPGEANLPQVEGLLRFNHDTAVVASEARSVRTCLGPTMRSVQGNPFGQMDGPGE